MRRALFLALGGLALAGAGVRAQTTTATGTESAAAGVAPAKAPNLGNVKDVVKDAVKDAAKAVQGKPVAPGTAAAAVTDPVARAALLRRKILKDDDFVEDDRNRDPFRSFLTLFTAKEGPRAPKVPAIFDKFAIEELTLIAIVSGDAQPRAMFRDPGGLGLTIKRGDYVSKVGARVSKILSDRIVLELNEVTATGETRVLEKAVLVNPEGAK